MPILDEIPHWDRLLWEDKVTFIRGFFRTGAIARASTEEMERFMVALGSTSERKRPELEAEIDRFSSAIRGMLDARSLQKKVEAEKKSVDKWHDHPIGKVAIGVAITLIAALIIKVAVLIAS